MNLRLRNSWQYLGDDRWDWQVFLEDDLSGDIDKVSFVEYILHPTFPNPKRIRKSKEHNFLLSTNGWGTFMIRAFANTNSGEKIKLEHYLHLEYDPPEGITD